MALTRHRRVLVALGAVAVLLLGTTAVVWRRASSRAARPVAQPAPRFVDVTASSGIVHAYEGDVDFFVGGGVAAFDCNGDDRADLFFAGGSAPAALYRNDTAIGGPLTFTRLASAVTDLTRVTGAYPIDVDGDGHLDLVVLRNGSGDVVLRGAGGCRFEPANERWGIDGGTDWTTAFSATWEAGQALPTLAFGSYLAADHQTCGTSRLVRPDASHARYGTPVPLAPGYCALSLLFSDWSRTGHADLRVANDRHYYTDGSEQLWRIRPDVAPTLYGTADGWRPLQIWGMGIASHDLDGDGYPEVFLTSQGDNKLQKLDPDATRPAYRDIALRSNATVQRPFTGGDVLPSTAWHPVFADVNDDGYTDLFVTKGNVDDQADHAHRDPSNLLLGRSDGTFVEGADAAGIVTFDRARGAAVVDLDLDGLLDLVVVNREAGVRVWHDVGRGEGSRPEAMGHWLAVRVQAPAPNVDAVGAWVDVRAGGRIDTQEITVGGGHAGGQLGWLHAGLGRAGHADVRVHWPDGTVGPWQTVRADTFVVLRPGASAQRVTPGER